MRACGDAQTTRARRDASRASASRATVGVWAAASVSLLFAVVVSSQRLPPYLPPPYVQSMSPDTGHVVGGTTVTMYGGGFHNHAGLSARFSYFDAATQTSETDVVPATFINFGTISFVTPSRKFAGVTHVTVSNNGVGYSTTPLNTDDDGTYGLFTYKSSAPAGNWILVNATGHSSGGAVVEIYNPSVSHSTRATDANFLPGAYLGCRFGRPADQSSSTSFAIGATTKTRSHPWHGRGSTVGFTVSSLRINGNVATESPSFILKRGVTYTFSVSSSGHPFYISKVEPSDWGRSSSDGNVIKGPIDSGTITFTPDSDTPNYIFYHGSSGSFMGGMIVVVDSSASDFETGNANGNTALAEWVNYDTIRCTAPSWVSGLDENTDHGGKQVTVYVTNDGVRYYGGQSTGDDAVTPPDEGLGSTFTYFTTSGFRDAPLYYAASGTSYITGTALALTSSSHTASTVYGDDGKKDATAATAYANAVTHHADQADDTSASGNVNDLVIEGTYTGGGLAWYEIVIDDATASSETFRWRLHTATSSNVAWVETGRAIPVGVSGGAISPSGALNNGISIRFTSSGSHHQNGDRWLIRVYDGKPNVISARTPQDEPTYPARGPFFGNTEITITGSGFFAASGVKCRLYDSGTTNNIKEVDGFFDNMNRVRCITPDHEPISGGEVPGTIRPCLTKSIEVTLDGSTYSAVKSNVNFLYCDVYVSKSGSDAYGDGTPSAPYLTLQRSIEAALDEPRSYDLRYELANPDEGIRGATQFRSMKFGTASKVPVNKGFAFYVNRDKIRVKTGTYSGPGNVGLHPLGKMLEAESIDGPVSVDCGAAGYTGVLVSGDRHGNEEVTNSGSLSFMGITHVDCA